MIPAGSALGSPALMFVTDSRRYAPGGGRARALEMLVGDAVEAARAGIGLIQVRERGLEDRELLALAQRIVAETSPAGARTLVNDRLDVALAAGAHGVHLPLLGMSSRAARSIVSGAFLIGRSVHTESEADAAQEEGGCDYLIFGSVFESASKTPGHPVAGLDALARVCANAALPVLAIGGITRSRVEAVARAGASGVAAIGLFASASGETLTEMVQEIRSVFGSI